MGVEYDWGESKLEFRRHINDEIPKHLHDNILKALSPDILPLGRRRKFARKTRDYRNVYRGWDAASGAAARAGVDAESMANIEKMRKERKSHRNIIDLELQYIVRS